MSDRTDAGMNGPNPTAAAPSGARCGAGLRQHDEDTERRHVERPAARIRHCRARGESCAWPNCSRRVYVYLRP